MHLWREIELAEELDRSDEAIALNVGRSRRQNKILQVEKKDLDEVMKEVQELKRA